MISIQESNLSPKSDSQWSSSERPFSLKELLQLRDGLELPRKTLPGFIVQRANPKLQSNDWIVISLN